MASSSGKEIHLLNPRNITALRLAFADIDKNGDGYISKSELSDAIKAVGRKISDKELDEIIKTVDKDGDNQVDFNEFLKLMDGNCFVQSVDSFKEMKDLFSLFDVDNDGFVTEEEISKTMKEFGQKIRKKDIRKMMQEADRNNDGKISFDEFKNMVLNSGKFLK